MFAVDPLPFVVGPGDDPVRFEPLFVPPGIMPKLLDARSTVVGADAGCGKTVLAEMTRSGLEAKWLCVTHEITRATAGDHHSQMRAMRAAIVQAVWDRVKDKPERMLGLGIRRRALRYFLNQHLGERNATYMLGTLLADHPALAQDLGALIEIPDEELFNPSATEIDRIQMLCDCGIKLGFDGVMIFVDWRADQPGAETKPLEDIFESLRLVRLPYLRFKCFAPSGLAKRLAQTNSLVRNSADLHFVRWTAAEIREIADRRIRAATSGTIAELGTLIDPSQVAAFLSACSTVESPAEWLAVARIILEDGQSSEERPLSEAAWTAAQRRYCAARLRLRRDDAGAYWRGPHRLDELTPRKRAIYSLIEFLYDNPGVQRPYKIAKAILRNAGARKKLGDGLDEGALNTTISRARDIIEVPLGGLPPAAENAIYLVTAHGGGGGYELSNVEWRPKPADL